MFGRSSDYLDRSHLPCRPHSQLEPCFKANNRIIVSQPVVVADDDDMIAVDEELCTDVYVDDDNVPVLLVDDDEVGLVDVEPGVLVAVRGDADKVEEAGIVVVADVEEGPTEVVDVAVGELVGKDTVLVAVGGVDGVKEADVVVV